jgi:hypothetical protein
MKEIIFGREFGFGDHFLLNGLVNYFSSKFDILYLPVYETSMKTIQCLYSENTKIKLLPITDKIVHWETPNTLDRYIESFDVPFLKPDLWNYRPTNMLWYHWWYEQFNLSYEYKYKYFALPENKNGVDFYKKHAPKQPYRFIHDGSSSCEKYPLDLSSYDKNLIDVRADQTLTDNMLDWVPIIMNAQEVHVTHSAFYHITDNLRDKIKSKIYYHDIRKSNDPLDQQDILKYNPKWTIIDYQENI